MDSQADEQKSSSPHPELPSAKNSGAPNSGVLYSGAVGRPILLASGALLFTTDLAHEGLVEILLHRPVVDWHRLLRARRDDPVPVSATSEQPVLPVHAALLSWLKTQHAAGRKIYVAQDAAAKTVLAGPLVGLAESLPIATDLPAQFPAGFTLVSDDPHAATGYPGATHLVLVGAQAQSQSITMEAFFPLHVPGIGTWLRALRPHHWAKNLLIFIPFMLDAGWKNPGDFWAVLAGFGLLILVVSSTYLFNDLCDLRADRLHWSKHARPIASGEISIRAAAVVSLGGISLGLLLALALSPTFAAFLLVYLTLTGLYSLVCKSIPLLDALVIAMLFTLRLMMGIALVGDRFSEWLLTFSVFFFFCLALAKRHTEILRAGTGHAATLKRRGYIAEDASLTLAIGVSCGFAALVIMVVYLVLDAFQSGVFPDPVWLWGVPILLSAWLGRVWLLAHRGVMADDPISFALRDRASLTLGLFVAVFFFLAL